MQLCSQAIEKDPKLTAAWIDRCQARLELSRLSEAMADCRQAIQLDPGNSEASLRLADVKAVSTPVDYPSVLETYAKSIELDPKNGTAYHNCGVTRHALKDYSGALADYNRAIDLEPAEVLASFNHGRALKPGFIPLSEDFDAADLKACR